MLDVTLHSLFELACSLPLSCLIPLPARTPVSLIPSKMEKANIVPSPCLVKNEKLHRKTEQCIEGMLLPLFPNVSGEWSWGLPSTHLIKVLPSFEIAFFLFFFFFKFIYFPRGWVELCFISSLLRGLIVYIFLFWKAVWVTLWFTVCPRRARRP